MMLQSRSQLDIILDGAQIFQIWVFCKKNMRGRIVVKRSHSLRRGLAAVLASLTLIQCAPLTASAAWWPWSNETAAVEETVTLAAAPALQNGTAIIPSDATPEEVKQALFDALVAEEDKPNWNAQELNWEYYCKGTEKNTGWGENWAWGSIDGFESKTGSIIKVTYTHPALVDNGDTSYKVRIDGTDETQAVTLTKASGLESSIVLKAGQSAGVTYNEDGSIEDRKSTRLNSSHSDRSRMPSSA